MSAGNQLFHVVVDNDDVATRITALLTAEKAGRVTFIPLNRINPQPVQYPDFGDDALPLVNKINCAKQHKKAVSQACPDTSQAASMPSNFWYDCGITLLVPFHCRSWELDIKSETHQS